MLGIGGGNGTGIAIGITIGAGAIAAPTVSSATVNGTAFQIVFNESVNCSSGSGITFHDNSGTPSVTYSSGSGTNTLNFTLGTAVSNGDTTTFDYASGSGNIVASGSGNTALASFTGKTVTNNTPVSGPTLVAHAATSGNTTPSANTTGANLIVAAASGLLSGSNTFTDSNLNIYTAIQSVSGGTTYACQSYCYNPIVGAGHTVNFTGGSPHSAVSMMAFSGIAAAPLDKISAAGAMQPGSVTPSQNNELLVCHGAGSLNPQSIDSGFTAADNIAYHPVVNLAILAGYLIQTTAAPINPTVTNASATMIATFR